MALCDWQLRKASNIITELVQYMQDDDCIARVFWLSLPMRYDLVVRAVLNTEEETKTNMFHATLIDLLAQNQDSLGVDCMSLDICERDNRDLRAGNISMWVTVTGATNGLIIENGNRLQLTWLHEPVLPEPQATCQKLEKKTVKELRDMCGKLGIKHSKLKRKAELIAVLERSHM